MSPSPLVKKLGIKPGMRMLIVAAPIRYLESLAPLPDGVQLAAAEDGPFAFVQLFVTDAADLGLHASKLLTEAGENAWSGLHIQRFVPSSRANYLETRFERY